MEEKIKIESIVLNDKRKKIMKELEEKRKTQEEVINMLKILTKESKGGYNQEKENVEKIYQILKVMKKHLKTHISVELISLKDLEIMKKYT